MTEHSATSSSSSSSQAWEEKLDRALTKMAYSSRHTPKSLQFPQDQAHVLVCLDQLPPFSGGTPPWYIHAITLTVDCKNSLVLEKLFALDAPSPHLMTEVTKKWLGDVLFDDDPPTNPDELSDFFAVSRIMAQNLGRVCEKDGSTLKLPLAMVCQLNPTLHREIGKKVLELLWEHTSLPSEGWLKLSSQLEKIRKSQPHSHDAFWAAQIKPKIAQLASRQSLREGTQSISETKTSTLNAKKF